MFWFRSKTILSVTIGCGFFIAASLPACKPDIKETGAKMKFFDIKGYFAKDSALLTKQNRLVLKSVSNNGFTQTKKVHIANWGHELSLFKESDINKPAWRDSYTVTGGNGITIYKATDPDLKTREIMIKQDSGKVKWIVIYNDSQPNKTGRFKNWWLYQTVQKLSYFPDSLYEIEMLQRVRLLGTNRYRIKGLLN